MPNFENVYIVYIHFACTHAFGNKYLMTDQPKKIKANKKDGQLLIRINSTERDEFIQLCEAMDTSAARELRKFIRSFMKKNQSADIHTKE